MADIKAKRRGRKPKPISVAMRTRICQEVSMGKSLRKVLRGKGMPSMSKVMLTLQEDPDFREQYARARRCGMELHIDGIIDLADTATDKNAHAIRLKVDIRKWLASKLLPKVYGDTLEPGPPAVPNDALSDEATIEEGRMLAFALTLAVRAHARQPKPPPLLAAPAFPPEPREVEVNPVGD